MARTVIVQELLCHEPTTFMNPVMPRRSDANVRHQNKEKRWIVTYNSLYVMCMDISEQAVFPGDKENGFFLIKMVIKGDGSKRVT